MRALRLRACLVATCRLSFLLGIVEAILCAHVLFVKGREAPKVAGLE